MIVRIYKAVLKAEGYPDTHRAFDLFGKVEKYIDVEVHPMRGHEDDLLVLHNGAVIKKNQAAPLICSCNVTPSRQRWVLLVKTSPSGKNLFACTICGRNSVFPDKDCPPFIIASGNREETQCSCRAIEEGWGTETAEEE